MSILFIDFPLVNELNTNDSLLVSAGANVNHSNNDGFTPLAAAAQASDVKSLRILLENGANVFSRSSNGFSPMLWALLSPLESQRLDNHSYEDLDLASIISSQSTLTAHHSLHTAGSQFSSKQQLECLEELFG